MSTTIPLEKRPAVPGCVSGVVKVLLRSPLHGLMSHNTLLLSFKGRKSGKNYLIPMSYIREGTIVTCFTDTRTGWWKNLQSTPVILHIKGQRTQGVAKAVQGDQTDIQSELFTFLRHSPRDATYKGIRLDTNGHPNCDDIAHVVPWAVMIQIHLPSPLIFP